MLVSIKGRVASPHCPHDVLKVPDAAREPVDTRDHRHVTLAAPTTPT